jgi:hypothetical protein
MGGLWREGERGTFYARGQRGVQFGFIIHAIIPSIILITKIGYILLRDVQK